MSGFTSACTRLAFLGTIGEMHRESLGYDLGCLRSLVVDLGPDLLYAEVPVEVWESGDLTRAPIEVRDALGPASAATDVVVVPVSPTDQTYRDFAHARRWGFLVVWAGERLLRYAKRTAPHPEAVNGHLFGALCHAVCWLTERAWRREDRALWREQNRQMAETILRAVARDPGRRVLVAVPCERLHRLVPLVRARAGGCRIVRYTSLRGRGMR